MNKRRLLQFAIPLSLIVLGIAGFLFFYARPLAIEVAQPEKDVPVQVYGLGTVEGSVALISFRRSTAIPSGFLRGQ